jgi:hypothetical protein
MSKPNNQDEAKMGHILIQCAWLRGRYTLTEFRVNQYAAVGLAIIPFGRRVQTVADLRRQLTRIEKTS